MSVIVPFSDRGSDKPFVTLSTVFDSGPSFPGRRFLVSTSSELVLLDNQLADATGIRVTNKRPKGNLPQTFVELGVTRKIVFAEARLSLVGSDNEGHLKTLTWRGVVGFWDSPVDYNIFGMADGLRLFNTTFKPDNRVVEFEPNSNFNDSGGTVL